MPRRLEHSSLTAATPRPAWIAPLASALLAVALLASPARPQSAAADDLVEVAVAAWMSGDRTAHRELASHGKAVLASVIDRLDGLPPAAGSGLPEGPEYELLAKALGVLPRPEVHRALTPDDGLQPERRQARLGALSEFGAAGEVNLVLALAGPCDSRGAMTRALQSTVERMHRRSPSSFRGIASIFLRSSLPLNESIVRGIAAVPRTDSVETLADLLDLVPALDPLILSSIGRIGSLEPLAVPDRVRGQVRRLLELDHEDPRVREAALTVGRLEDALAMNTLVDLLESTSSGVRGNAHWSLRHVSGLPLGPEYMRWLTWLRGNEQWWSDHWPSFRAALRGGDRAETSEAIREIAGRRYRRHELAEELLYVLRRTDDEVLLGYACLALTALRSPVAHAPLIDLLHDSREEVRARAHDALRSLTDLDLPPDPNQWREALASA